MTPSQGWCRCISFLSLPAARKELGRPLKDSGSSWCGQVGVPLAFRVRSLIVSALRCLWLALPAVCFFLPSSLSPAHQGSSVTPQSPGLAASAGVPLPHHTASSGSGLSSCSLQRGGGYFFSEAHAPSERTAEVFELLPLCA